MHSRCRVRIQLLLPITATLLTALFAANADPETPIKAASPTHFNPIVQEIEGWKVDVDPKMLKREHATEGARALTMLTSHLQRIAIMIPRDEEVLAHTGHKVRAYAATTPMEYFAEGTEVYFDRNDFYPFVRAKLKEHDPVLDDLLEEIWGVHE